MQVVGDGAHHAQHAAVGAAGDQQALAGEHGEVARAHGVEVDNERAANLLTVLSEERAHAGMVAVARAEGDEPDVVGDKVVVAEAEHGLAQVGLAGSALGHACLEVVVDHAQAGARGGSALPAAVLGGLVGVVGIIRRAKEALQLAEHAVAGALGVRVAERLELGVGLGARRADGLELRRNGLNGHLAGILRHDAALGGSKRACAGDLRRVGVGAEGVVAGGGRIGQIKERRAAGHVGRLRAERRLAPLGVIGRGGLGRGGRRHGRGAVGVGLGRQAGVVGIKGLAVGKTVEVDGGAVVGLVLIVLLCAVCGLLGGGIGERDRHSRGLGRLIRSGVDARGGRGGLVGGENGSRRGGVLLGLGRGFLLRLGLAFEGDEVVGRHRRGSVGGIGGLFLPKLLVLGDGNVVGLGVVPITLGGATGLDHLSGGVGGRDNTILRVAEEAEDRLDGRRLVLRIRCGHLDVEVVVGKRGELSLLVVLGGGKVRGHRGGGYERAGGGTGRFRRGGRRRDRNDDRLGLHVLDLAVLGKHAEALHDVGTVANAIGLHRSRGDRGRRGLGLRLRRRSRLGIAEVPRRKAISRGLRLSDGRRSGLGRLLHGLNGVVDGLRAVDALQAGGAHILEHAEHGGNA